MGVWGMKINYISKKPSFGEEICCSDFQPSADAQKRGFKIKRSYGASGVPLLEIRTTFDEHLPFHFHTPILSYLVLNY
jgi:hypothetical protein